MPAEDFGNSSSIEPPKTASQSKLERFRVYRRQIEHDSPEPSKVSRGFRIIDINILEQLVSMIACPECGELDVELTEGKAYGLATKLILDCQACGYQVLRQFTS